MADVARALADAATLQDTLQRVAQLSVEVIPDVDCAGVSLIHPAGISTPAASSPIVEALDALQDRLFEGPCFDAARDGRSQYASDLATHLAWPRFAPAAVRLDIRSVLAYALSIDGSCIGTLNLYSRKPGAFTVEDMEVGAIFAAHSTVAISSASRLAVDRQELRHLQLALNAHDVVSIAKGIVMERQHLDEAQAFDVLYRAALRLKRTLDDVAADVVELRERSRSRRPEVGR